MNDTVCQLNDFLKELKAEYSKYIASQSKRIMFLLDERNFLPNISVQMDTDTLKKILGVLVGNAVKYTDKGYIKVGYRILDNGLLQFFVEDTGTGFEPVVLEEMIKFLDENKLSGENVENLSDVNNIVKADGGKVRIDSQQGMGTTVYFNLIFQQVNISGDSEDTAEGTADKEAEEQAKENTLIGIWNNKTIMIAEDEIVNYMFLEVLFEETGANLIHASDGQQAIDTVKNNPDINLVLMDIKMPNVNGLEATKEIKSIRPQLPIIAQTAYAMQDDEYKALQAGCNDYISKPIDANRLISLMKKYLW